MKRTHASRLKKPQYQPMSQTKSLQQVQSAAVPPAIQTKSNEEGLAEWKAQQEMWARFGTPWMDKVPNPSGDLAQPKIQEKLMLKRSEEGINYAIQRNEIVVPEKSSSNTEFAINTATRSEQILGQGALNPVEQVTLPSHKEGIIQRMVVFNNQKNVYIPSYLNPKDNTKEGRMKTSVNTLTGRNDNLVFPSSSNFDDILQKNIADKSKKLLKYENKYTEKDQAKKLTASASKKQQKKGLDHDQRKVITDKLGDDLAALTVNPTWEKNVELCQEFSDARKVYIYPNDKVLDNIYTFPTEFNLIAPEDMVDAPGDLEVVGNPHDICAIEAISDLGGDVRDMWGNLESSTSAEGWHRACRAKGLDYRNDNEYIKILMKLGYTLAQNHSVTYNQIDWTADHLGDGKYFLATGAGEIGHAIGVEVGEGVVTTIYDNQKLHENDINVKYIFKQ